MFIDDDAFGDSNVVPWAPAREKPMALNNMASVIENKRLRDLVAYRPVGTADQTPGFKSAFAQVEEIEWRGDPDRSYFLELPLEIRLQIYSWVHLSTPFQQTQLAPWYPTPAYSAYFLQAIAPGLIMPRLESGPAEMGLVQDDQKPASDAVDETSRARSNYRLLASYRPLSCLPSSLLRACRQVYAESRTIPFERNEFVFVTWFSSGLSAAQAFVRRLQPWQRQHLRYVRLEVEGRDVIDEGRLANWTELCGFWKDGLRGLRLKIAATDPAFPASLQLDWKDAQGHGGPEEERERQRAQTSGSVRLWVDKGLKQLRALEHLELELVNTRMSNEEKLIWGHDFETMLNADKEGHGTRVLCVERRQ